jgi:nitroreductase
MENKAYSPQSPPDSPVIEQMKAHRSVRAFRDEPLPEGWVETIVSAAQWASSSSFRQSYSVIAVKDPQTRAALRSLCGGQRWVEECAVFLAFCADLNRSEEICAQRGLSANLEYTEIMLLAAVDTALLMQNAALAAESLGLGMVMIGGLRNYPRQVARLLELPHGVFGVAGMCLGFPAKTTAQRPRLPLEEVLHWERYDAAGRQERLDAYDRLIRSAGIYPRKEADPEGWSDVLARGASQPLGHERASLKEFLGEQGLAMK